LIREFSSKLAVEVLTSGGGRIKEKIVRTCWNKSFSDSRAKMLTPSF
jgi:hypothetical protein